MSKVLVNSNIKSNDEINTFKGIGIYKDNSIYYDDSNIKTVIKILSDKIIIKRENSEYSFEFNFIKNKKTNGKYLLKKYNNFLDMVIYTSSINIEDDKLEIRYELYIDGIKSTDSIYKLNWRNIDES